MINHWWQVPLYVTTRGLTTSTIAHRARTFQNDLDFIEHNPQISHESGRQSPVALHHTSGARFSGRRAPPHPGAPNVADQVTREAYSHEVSSAGFWPGTAGLSDPVFYAYAYPEPNGFAQAPVAPAAASYDAAFGEFLLPYEAVRQAAAPDDLLLEFLQSTYEAAADLGRWARAELERA